MPKKKSRFHKCRECDWAEFALFLFRPHFGYFCNNWHQETRGDGKICNKVDFTKKGKKLKKVDGKWVLRPADPVYGLNKPA